ncbi:hypothetical protein DNJ95_15010 [Stutzerimonas kirkiae]|uniref:Uncharacterized protein n=1 Tax=Stutzerimonas kirkiae TaxID=2211392 RepID=A0A4Q9R163_9GAMM|nr:YeeE/YedE family protein [Stutzerimonas kirkiae]TBU91268.1 hypothetical protein DNJ96_16005 [Stutzerimonas kirkiae]TBV00462.1 hypothetical protein DNJ95_15010 [Stutzerimonas kirkiae]TBV15246.1 hypothetical protein DNK01_06070 [Stutzerimonas kirkiae]
MTVDTRFAWLPVIAGASILSLLLLAGWRLDDGSHEGRLLGLSLILGGTFGWVLQRSRFCFFCISREYLEERDGRGLLGLIAALAVGLVGYHGVFGAFLPEPVAGRLPPGAHIGPVSYVLALAALVFGIGMSVSGSCISAHLYRLGEGSIASLAALVGALFGFILGFLSWNGLYLSVIQASPVIWLPHSLGYAGSLLLQLAVLAVIALWLSRRSRPAQTQATPEPVRSLPEILLRTRWPVWCGGLLVAFIGTIAYLRVAPLGVTAELGSIARTLASGQGWLPERLHGLDGFRGCATVIKESLLSNNGVFIAALVLASLGSALIAGDFRPRWPGLTEALRNLGGGILMGWGAMVGLGCTVGTLLSGIMAGALSGWLFALFCFLGLWLGLKGRRRFEGVLTKV